MIMSTVDVFDEVARSKKYSHIYDKLLQRICDEEYAKHKRDKERVKAAKSRLHQLFGAYSDGKTHATAASLLSNFETAQGGDLREYAKDLMRLHTSSNERVATVTELYAHIFEQVGQIDSVLDIGCGFNPFALPFMPAIQRYHAYDIDLRTVELINQFFASHGLAQLAGLCDIVTEIPDVTADVAFLFKLLPLLDTQKAGRADELLCKLDVKHIVVTYPIASLSGRGKGMEQNYSASFEGRIEGRFALQSRAVIGNELVYIIRPI